MKQKELPSHHDNIKLTLLRQFIPSQHLSKISPMGSLSSSAATSGKVNSRYFNGYEFSQIFFPAPKFPTYTPQKLVAFFEGSHFCELPSQNGGGPTHFLFIPYYRNQEKTVLSPNVLIYFHGNAQDVGASAMILEAFHRHFKLNVVAMEYPGYGYSREAQTKPDAIKANASNLYTFLANHLGFQESNIVICGRSIGSGTACHLASFTGARHLILISAFHSISKIVWQKAYFLNFMVSNFFPNDECVKKTRARLLVIHGRNDEVISVKNSHTLIDEYNKQHSPQAQYHFPQSMTHNEYDIEKDIIEPCYNFLTQLRKQSGIKAEDIAKTQNILGKLETYSITGKKEHNEHFGQKPEIKNTDKIISHQHKENKGSIDNTLKIKSHLQKSQLSFEEPHKLQHNRNGHI